ncbi:CDI toxin immunity protein [Erwinia sp. MYb416]|uniref:CDI toxin immunity protein n=1 Tax=Erwinia sp. MYb416 TaxID=3108532 RepID=UPI0030A071E8
MTLFDECKEALAVDFNIVIGAEERKAIDMLYNYPLAAGGVLWDGMKYSDYDDLYNLLNANLVKKHDVFVLADDAEIPLFRTNIRLIAENVYDVTALSPKLFIYNDEIIIQPLFPSESFRVGLRSDNL